MGMFLIKDICVFRLNRSIVGRYHFKQVKVGDNIEGYQQNCVILTVFLLLLFPFPGESAPDNQILNTVLNQEIIPSSNNMPLFFLLHWLLQKPFLCLFLQGLNTYIICVSYNTHNTAYASNPCLFVCLFYFAFSTFLIAPILFMFMAWLHITKNMLCVIY